MAQSSKVLENQLLSALAPGDLQQILSLAQPVPMPLRTSLFEPGEMPQYVHFLTSGMASVVTEMSVGEGVEVSVIGREGLPECLHLLGPETGISQCFMQVEGTALRMNFGKFQKLFLENASIRKSVLRYVQYQSLVMGQLVACNRLHGAEERLARWLLIVADRTDSLELELTQEFLSEMLGTRRSTVTLTAAALQRSGLLQYKRGKIRILDRAALEDVACECYGVIERLLHRLYK